MNGLFLHTSNHLETLAAELSKVVSEPPDSPFTPEIVMVQSLGMRRWISLQLADRLGICMRCEFPFPAKFMETTLRGLVPEMAHGDEFSAESMTWKIHRILPELLPEPEFEPVRLYAGSGDGIKLYQLASRLAHLFDQYLVYRPEMMLRWEADPRPLAGDEAWQAALWRELNAAGLLHFAAALERLNQNDDPPAEEARRISIFGISSLPPAQMRVFLHLAASRPVHLFLLAPSREYHGDDLTPKQRARCGMSGLEADLWGNPLLTSLGRLNAHFTEVLLEADERAGHRLRDESEEFTETAGDTLLHRVQRDVLLARNPASEAAEEAPGPAPILPGDTSLQVHVCHSPMREVEVLYDQLLAMFDAQPELLPRDVLVMAPDIESYAPFIHAVFGYPEDPALRIAFSVADRKPRSESVTIDTFLRLLELPQSRCTAPELYALLQSAPFRHRFGFEERDLDQIRLWIHGSGIRWGIDGEHRAELGLPAFPENTWRHGLDRLLLGYAMPGKNRTLFEGILPHDDVEGTGAELLGRMASALEALFTTAEELKHARPLGEWPAALEAVADRFFDDDEDPHALTRLRELLGPRGKLATTAAQAGPKQTVEFEVIRMHLTGLMGEAEQQGSFLTGGVTFCALKPMRSIPAKVIWLLGMNDDAFPRKAQPLQFDLMARGWKLGDRSVRDDDRYIFLEVIVSARDRLCISYLGRSVVSNEAFPPSVVVSELLDYVEQAAGSETREAVLFEHPLQAFSPRYFEGGGGSRLFSYSQANAAASRLRPSQSPPQFSGAPLPEPREEERTVELKSLLDFFSNPAAFFLRRRLGFRLEDTDETLPENEPMEVDALAKYGLRNELFQPMLCGTDAPGPGGFTARAMLPPGSIGTQHFDQLQQAVRAFHHHVAPLLGAEKPDEPRLADLTLGGFTLSGVLDSIYAGRMVLFRPAKLKPKDWLRAWIRHLIWCASEPAPELHLTVLAGEDRTVFFGPPEKPASELLQELLEIYWRGLSEPVPFFPSSAFAFGQALASQSKRARPPLELAQREWNGGQNMFAEKDDAAYRLCFGERDPLTADFEQLARAVIGPMLAACKTE